MDKESNLHNHTLLLYLICQLIHQEKYLFHGKAEKQNNFCLYLSYKMIRHHLESSRWLGTTYWERSMAMIKIKNKLITGMIACSLMFGGQAVFAEEHSSAITRAEFVVMLTSTLGWAPEEEPKYLFADVSREEWYTPYLSQAKQMGLITGQTDGKFYPEAPISRAEVAVLLKRAYPDLPVINSPIYFDDVYGQHWAESEIEYAAITGLLQGYDQYTFGPNRYMTKAEAELLNSRLVALDKNESPVNLAGINMNQEELEVSEQDSSNLIQVDNADTVIHYTVEQGDSLWKLAQVYGTSVEAIVEANQLPNDSLQIGQELFIPVSEWQMSLRNTLIASGGVNMHTGDETESDAEIEVIEWSQANQLFAINYIAKITDVYTGTSFYVKRFAGVNHADVEPLTRKDTEIMNQIWGGPTWDTRPIIVEVEGRKLAAAMHNMPHDIETITDNDYPGHTCIHFLGSTKHNNGQAWPEMQRDVQIAATYGR